MTNNNKRVEAAAKTVAELGPNDDWPLDVDFRSACHELSSEILHAADAVMFSDESMVRAARVMASQACSKFDDHSGYWLLQARAVAAALKGVGDE